MFPLIPFLLVVLVIGLQLLPLVLGNGLYTIVIAGGIAVTALEQVLWYTIITLLALLSLYMIASSIFALYIVTLPNMTPIKALRSARELVHHRRWTIMRKVIALPIILLTIAAILLVPTIAFAPVLAQWLFFVITIASLPIIHAYMYNLYRSML
jgi:hypothetical protein